METTQSSGSDPTDDALADLVREAQEELDGSGFGLEGKARDQGELIEGPYSVTFILMAPGYSYRDFDVSASKDSLSIGIPGFRVARHLRWRVDPSTVQASYRNGVFTVRIAKAF